MKYDRILRRVWVEINGREYALVFSLSVFEKLDAEAKGNLLQAMATNEIGWALMGKAFRLALHQGDKSIAEDKANALFEAFLYEHGIPQLPTVFWGAVAVSGLMGAKASAQMLANMGGLAKDITEEEDEPAKNAKVPKE